MARPLRLEYPGAIYHVTLRGVGRQRIFKFDSDRERFLQKLEEGVELDGVRIYLFCLMSNHVHLVLETPQANLSRFMHRLQTGYTVYFNRKHRRAGHLMQGRYNAKLVEGDEYLLNLSRYVHLNPVRVAAFRNAELPEIRSALRKYPWSSFRSYAGKIKPLKWLDYGPTLAMMTGTKNARARSYGAFVESGLANTDEEFEACMKESPLAIGSNLFLEHVSRLYEGVLEMRTNTEDVSFRSQKEWMDPERVVDAVCKALEEKREELQKKKRGSVLRPVAARMLTRYAGLSQREIADMMGISTGASVSEQLLKLQERMDTDKHLRKLVARIESELDDVNH